MTPLPALPDDRTTSPLSPEERDAKLRLDASNVLTWEQPSDVDPLMFGHLRRFAAETIRLLDDVARLTVALQAATEDGARLGALMRLLDEEGQATFTLLFSEQVEIDELSVELGPRDSLTELLDALRETHAEVDAAALPTEDTKR